jgi:hypothetical protein
MFQRKGKWKDAADQGYARYMVSLFVTQLVRKKRKSKVKDESRKFESLAY